MRILLVVVLVGCAAAPSAPAATLPTVRARCVDHIVGYRDWRAIEDSAEWSVELASKTGGALVLLGIHHTDDPADPQFAAIDRAWAALRPTASFYEGPDRPISDTAEATITATGESGYVRFLARRDGISTSRLDPDPLAEAAHILSLHPRDRAYLFYLLREMVRLRDRKGVPSEQLRSAAIAMVSAASARGIPGFFSSIEDFERAYRAELGDPAAWWEVPSWWFGPMPQSDERWTHRVNRDSSEFRNRNMFEVLTAATLAGRRVFAAVGANHVPMIAPALRCALAATPIR